MITNKEPLEGVLNVGQVIHTGGGGGTSDYEELTNKPLINNVGLIGNKSLEDLGIQPAGSYATTSDIPTKTSQLDNDSGFITSYTETDPIFTASPAHGITSEDITAWNNKQVAIQYSTVPTASVDNVGDIIQFTGTTDSTYTNGYFYICTLDNGTYKWENLNVQPSSGGGGSTGVIVNNANYSDATIVSAVNAEYQKFVNGQEYNVWWQGNSGGINTLIPMHFWYNAFYQPYLAGLMPSNYFSSGNAYWLKAVINCYKTGTNVTSLWPNASTLVILKGNDQLLTSGNDYSYNVNKDYVPAHKKYVDEKPTTWSGYDATKTQVLKNINGTLTWVDE